MFSKFMIPIAVLETLKSMIAGSIFDIFDINQRHLTHSVIGILASVLQNDICSLILFCGNPLANITNSAVHCVNKNVSPESWSWTGFIFVELPVAKQMRQRF